MTIIELYCEHGLVFEVEASVHGMECEEAQVLTAECSCIKPPEDHLLDMVEDHLRADRAQYYEGRF